MNKKHSYIARTCLVCILFLLVYGNAFAQAIPEKQNKNDGLRSSKPNIVFFLVDDLGWSDLGFEGSSFYETPNIDKFAREGVSFSNAYAASHVCSPSRASIISGQYPARLHLTDWLPGRKNYPFQKLSNADIVQHLPYDILTLPEILKENGYATAIFGKWHLGEDSMSTERQGFDLHIPDYNKGWPNGTYFSPYNMKGLEGGPDGEYLTDRLTSEAIKYIDANKEKPFFLFLSHFAVHDPIEGRPDLVKKYQKKLAGMQTPKSLPFILEPNPDDSIQLTREELNDLLDQPDYKGFELSPHRTVKIKQIQDNVQFAAMVESVDESFGRIISELDKLGLRDNTIIIFFSDNGGMSAANYYKPDRKIASRNLDKAFSTSNLPLRGGKGWLYEGGIREPLIIQWKGIKLKKGTVSDIPVISTDFYPTLIDLAGIFPAKGMTLDGISIGPLLKKSHSIDNLKGRALYWHFPQYSNHGQQSPGGAIRLGDFKLLEYYENYRVQLFDLKNDPGEQHDLSREMPEKVKQLKKMLDDWRISINANMPYSNPGYDPSFGNEWRRYQ